MRRFLPLTLFLLPLLSFSGHAAQPSNVLRLTQEADPSTLDLAQYGDIATLDPARAYDSSSVPFVRVLYRGLVDYDFEAKIQPEIAQSYSVSRDGKTYRFQLRRGVKWWDGTPVEAEDFRYAIEHTLNPETVSDGVTFFTDIVGAEAWTQAKEVGRSVGHIKGIEVPSAREIVFRLNRPNATFLGRLTLPFASGVPRKYVEKLRKQYGGGMALSDALSDHPMGDGPFKFVNWVHGSHLRLEKNRTYFRPGFPKANVIEARLGVDFARQTKLFEQGSLDILPITDAPASEFLRFKNSPKWKNLIADAPLADVRYLSMNTEVMPFKDRRVRQAICYAINRDRIISFVTGRATKARGALPEGVPSYDPKLFSYPYNPTKARQLLKEAKFKSTGTVPLLFSFSEPWYGKAAQSIQQDLAAVGIQVEPRGMRYGDMKAIAGRRGPAGARLAIQGWVQDFPDPSNFLDPLFNGRSITKTASLNRSFYSNPQVNKLLNEALKIPNSPARWAKYREAQRILVSDAPVVFLHNTRRYVVHQPRVRGFRLHPAWPEVYEYFSVN